MDMINKLKSKFAEEFESETESEVGGNGSQDGNFATEEDRLRDEVHTLKEHINKNYFVYVKRLEKRKERIKELENLSKNLNRENEELKQELKVTFFLF